jgi:hypothetical protein
MFSANMRLELFVALPLILSLHLIKCVADKWSWRLELPSTRSARPALKALFFNPY